MEWKDIAAVSGKSGLYKVVKPTRAGFILESIDAEKKRFMAGPSMRVSVLHEISIYTDEDAVALSEVMQIIKKDIPEVQVDLKSEGADLMDFLKQVVPNYDIEKVYASDVKKLVAWYGIINEFFPELLEEKVEQEEESQEEVKAEEVKKDESVTKKVAEQKEETKEK